MSDQLDRPILITGTPRSGKSCIGKVLRHDPTFWYAGEAIMLWDAPRRGRPDDRLTEAEATPEMCRRIRNACARQLARSGRRRYMDCLAHHAISIPFVRQVLPDVRIIHVIRDPSEVIPEIAFGWTYRDTVGAAVKRRRNALSWRTLPRLALRFGVNYMRSRLTGRRASWGPRVPGLSEFARHHSPAEIAAYQWQQIVRIARQDLAAVPPEQRLEVRFENLLSEPAEQYRRLAEFIEVDDIVSTVDRGANFMNPDHVFERKVQPTEAEWERIYELIGATAREVGYFDTIAAGDRDRRGGFDE